MEKSQTISELSKALVSFQSEMETIGYDANNPFFKSKYATLTNLVECSKKVLSKHGLAVTQLAEDEGAITTVLMHTSGEYLSSKLTLKPVKDDPQGRGSCLTYARRYSYASILGLVSDEDDDGNKASNLISHEAPMTQKDFIKADAKKKFKNPDEFNAWLVDNDLPENLEKCNNVQLAKISALLRSK